MASAEGSAGLDSAEVSSRLSPASMSALDSPEETLAELCACVPAQALQGLALSKLAQWALWECPSGRAGLARARHALSWVRLALQYDLAATSDLSCLVEPLLATFILNKSLRPIVADLLCSVVVVKHVTSWRVKALQRLGHCARLPKDKAAVATVAGRFSMLKPGSVPAHLLKIRAKMTSSSASTNADPLSAAFEAVWRDRTPIDAEMDDLVAQGRLTWEADQVYEDQVRSSPPAKRPRRARTHLRHMLGGPQPNRLAAELRKHGRREDDVEMTSLQKCSRVGDVYDNVSKILPPARTTALLCNRGTFFLLAVAPPIGRFERNSAAVTRQRLRLLRESRHRLALTLHHVLHNEFFASEDSGTKCKS